MHVRAILLATALALTGGLTGTARQPLAVDGEPVRAAGAAARLANQRLEAMRDEGRLRFARVQIDTVIEGRAHERFAQYHEGLPVFGAAVVRQIDGAGVSSVFGRTFEGIVVNTSATVALDAAVRLAAADIGGAAVVIEEPALGILPHGDGFVLVWRVPVRSDWSIDDVYVDAATGETVQRRSRLRPQLEDIGMGFGVFRDQKKVAARRGPNGFEAYDAVRPGPTRTHDFLGSASRLNSFFRNGLLSGNDLARDADNRWDDGPVVDAHVYAGFAYDYFYKRFGRRGMDDANGPVLTVVHPLRGTDAPLYDSQIVGLFINNALYLGGRHLMFGDGDGRVFEPLAGALDVVVHEWAHGVTEYGADLLYEDEPGALNESFSDIMATAAEFMFQEPGQGRNRADWVLGEDVTKLRLYLRSMSDPASAGFPDHYSLRRFIGTDIDNGGVHVNSSISNHAFYLAVAGGRNRVSGISVPGVGLANMERIERVFYRAFVYLLTPRATFADARRATLAAAAELYGAASAEREQVEQAWTAVGVH